MTFFLKIPVFMSADMASLWHTRPGEQFILQNFKTQRHSVFLKIPYLSRMINRKIHADLSVHLFPRAIRREVPPPKA